MSRFFPIWIHCRLVWSQDKIASSVWWFLKAFFGVLLLSRPTLFPIFLRKSRFFPIFIGFILVLKKVASFFELSLRFFGSLIAQKIQYFVLRLIILTAGQIFFFGSGLSSLFALFLLASMFPRWFRRRMGSLFGSWRKDTQSVTSNVETRLLFLRFSIDEWILRWASLHVLCQK